MRVSFTVGVYQNKVQDEERWDALVPTVHAVHVTGTGGMRMRERMADALRQALRHVDPADQELFQLPLGTELARVPIDLRLDDGRVHGSVPLIVEPRWTGTDRQRYLVYHPARRDEWFLADARSEVAQLAPAFFRHFWRDLTDEHASTLLTAGKDRLVPLALTTEPRSLLDQLPSRKRDPRARASAPRLERVLHQIGTDETARLASEPPADVPRAPYRERLAYLLGGARPRSVAVVGPPGSGKTSLIRRWIADRLAEDGYALHQNLDRVLHVWRLAGKRLIAGMSYLGQWEERCLAILDEARRHRALLWIEDLHLWGRLGQARGSERSFADFFRGPVRRGDLAIVAELTAEQHARIERDAPGLAEALAPVVVAPASPGETTQLLLHEVRALELRLGVALDPLVPRTALEQGTALFPWRARPGVAIEIVRRVAETAGGGAIEPEHVLGYLAGATGLARSLIFLDTALDPAEVEAAFARRVIGQPAATRAAADVILKVRAGLADPNRPIHVMLFTGPTGTGKTELATAIAEYLYGGGERLLRIDMGELSGPDAVARLIGDRWNPEGLLTSRVRAQPFCVVLLDEIEKAHPLALHLLLQLFDEGRLTDAAGDVASFASAVVIMTSNLGSRTATPIGFGETRDRILADVARAVRDFFPVELFNRIDQVVPFEPLTPEVAAKVVDKELGKLLARRGLRERNTFVYVGAAVRRLAVEDAFDPRYGARTVKRWLEDRVGGALTDLLATAPPARLRIVRLAQQDGAVAASLEPLAEKPAVAGPYLLEGALELATAGLEPVIAAALAAIRRIRSSPDLARARAEATGELRFYVDDLQQRLDTLGELLGDRPARPRDDDDRHDDPIYEEKVLERWPGRVTSTRRVRDRGGPGRRIPARDELLEAVATALLYERALPELLDPDAHAVTVVIGQVGTSVEADGVAVVGSALTRPEWLDDVASLAADGTIRPKARALGELARPGERRDYALVLRGLFVRPALAAEHGTWMIRASAAEPDVVRVEVRAGAPAGAEAVLRAHAAARAAFERTLEEGGALPPNPDALLPVTRTLTYRAPLRSGEPFAVELEDFTTGWVDRGTARSPAAAIVRAWWLAWSRAP